MDKEQFKLLDEAVAFAKMISHDTLAKAFIATLGMYVSVAVETEDRKERLRRFENIATILAPLPIEIIELVAQVLSGKEVHVDV